MNAKDNGLDKLYIEYLNSISSDEESDAFLREQGLDPDKLVIDGLKKIRQMKMNIAAEETERKYQSMKSNSMDKAKKYVDGILADASFNLQAFIKANSITVSFRNFEEIDEDEVRQFLERHFMLKFEKEKEKE